MLFCVLFVCKCVLYCTVLYCTVLYCAVLYCTALYCTALYCTVLYRTLLYCTVLYCTVLYCAVLYCTALYCTVLYCTVLYCTVLYSTLLYCTVLYSTVLLPPGVNPIAVNKYILSSLIFFVPGQHLWAQTSLLRYGGHTQTHIHISLSRTPLHEWSASRRYFYLTTHTRSRRLCLRRESNPQFQQVSAWERAVTAIGWWHCSFIWMWEVGNIKLNQTKLRGLSPRANYTDRAAAAGRRS